MCGAAGSGQTDACRGEHPKGCGDQRPGAWRRGAPRAGSDLQDRAFARMARALCAALREEWRTADLLEHLALDTRWA